MNEGDDTENVFLKAALTGKLTYPTRIRSDIGMNLASAAEPAVASSQRGGRKQLKPRYTPVEDHMILQAIEIHGRNWHNVLKFLRCFLCLV